MRSVCSQTGAVVGQVGRGELGQRVDAGPQLRDALGRQRPAQLGEVQGEEREGEALRRERLRRGDADLAAAARVERAVGLARELRSHLVADRERERAALARDALRGDRVGRLARLRDGDRERALVDHGIAVAELGGVLDVDGEPGPLLDQQAADHAGMAGGAAGRDRDAVDREQLLVGEAGVEHDLAALEPLADRLAQRVGLLVDLLEHERLVAALLGGGGVPRDRLGVALDGGAVEIEQLERPRA